MDKPISPPVAVPSQRLLRRRIPIAWVQLGILLIALAVLPLGHMVDPDFWWHLRTGNLIVHSGIPRHDPFSWTAAGKVWVAHEWLSEVVIYGVESTLGYIGNILLFGSVTAGALGLMYALGRRLGVGTKPLVLLTLLAAAVLVRFVTVRPQEFTWLLFAVFVYVLARREEGDDAPLWVLPPLMAVWVNLHLGFFYGLMVVGIWTVVQAGRHWRRPWPALRTPLLVAGGCVLATFLNPSGPSILLYPAHYLQGHAERSLLMEWQRPNLLSPAIAPVTGTIFLLGLSLLSRRRPFLTLLSLAAVTLSLQALRNAPLAVLMLMPAVGSAASDRWAMASRARDSSVTMPVWRGGTILAATVAVVLIVGAQVGGTFSVATPSDSGYPAAGAALIAERYPDARLLNDYNWGGYLINRLYGTTPVFIDGREEFYGGRIMGDFVSIFKAKPGWDELLSRYGVDVVMVQRNCALATALRSSDGWREEFVGPVEVVFVRS